MRGNAVLMMLLTILPLALTVLAAQETTSPSIGRQVGDIGVIQVQAQEQAQSPSGQPFSLRNGITIHLSGGWGPDTYDRIPTPSVLDGRAPREIGFSEFLNLQNLNKH